jgi:acetylornithine deacetylase/succinyl-diaminopimelate desuccinylase-like protein
MQEIFERIDARLDESIAELADFVRIPSISAGTDKDAASIQRAADFLLDQFASMDFAAQKIQVSADTHPLVLAKSPGFSNERPTVMVYGHYDVQGVDNPRSAWDVDPFAAVTRDGYLIARGASDNKGPTFAHIKAVETIMQSGADLPVDLLFVIEGEEECGSRALGTFIEQGGLDEYAPFLCTVISDTSMYGPDRPSLTLGLRGIVYFEVAVHGPKQDVHSGLFGGIVHNPNQVLLQALAGLFDAEGHIAVPGFYDGMTPLSAREKSLYAALGAKEEDYCRELGVEALKSEGDHSLLERRWTRPTLEINYLSGGSPRTVIPAIARAAVSARLVPGQDPDKVQALLEEHIGALVPKGARVEFSHAHTSPAYYVDIDHPLVEPTLSAMRQGFDTEALLTREGGSIPIVVDIAARTEAPVLLVGLGQITDNWHGPNERFSLRDFHRGMRTSAALLHELGKVS